MEKKDLLIELCKGLQDNLNTRGITPYNGPFSVKLEAGLKPANYFLPMIYLGRGEPIDQVELAWFAEIFVNSECIFRESYIPRESESLEIVEGTMYTVLLRSIFEYGIMTSRDQLHRLKSQH